MNVFMFGKHSDTKTEHHSKGTDYIRKPVFKEKLEWHKNEDYIYNKITAC